MRSELIKRLSLIGVAFVALPLAGCGVFKGGGGPKTPTVGQRISILSNDASVHAALIDWIIVGDVPDRLDRYTNLAVPAAGVTVTFVRGTVRMTAEATYGAPRAR